MKGRNAAILLGFLALLGLVDAAYLTWDHLAHLSDPTFGGGLCGAGGGCDISRTSAASEIPLGRLGPGLPISLLAAGFYVAFGLLLALRARRPEGPHHAHRVMLATATLASGYSLGLGALSLIAQGSLCPLCTVLYLVNLALFALTFVSAPEPFVASVKRIWGSIISKPGVAAALAFALVVGGGYVGYRATLNRRLATVASTGRVELIDTEGRPTVGDPAAPVEIVEIADLKCPHCRVLYETLKQVQAERPADVRVTFMHCPLDMACNRLLDRDFHKGACQLARVAECAGDQGRFAEVAGALMKHHRDATERGVEELVKGLGLNMPVLAKCVADPRTDARIKADIEQGIRLGITGTPVFFVNGRRLSGARSADVIHELIDQALAGAQARGGAAP